METQDIDEVETYYKDNTAVFTLTIDEEKNLSSVDDIRELIGDDNAMDGSAVSTAVSTTSTVKGSPESYDMYLYTENYRDLNEIADVIAETYLRKS